MIFYRWGLYLLEMYQPLTRLVFSVCSYLSVTWLSQRALGLQPDLQLQPFVLGVATMMLILLYYRICDEFKDLDTDLQFFPERPVPAGRVHLKDLHILRGLSVVLAFALNLLWPQALLPFVLLYAYAYLMGKWFFVPAMAHHRLWAFVTHSPISLWGYVYLLALSNAWLPDKALAPPLWSLQSLLIVCWLVLPGMAWEFARKTRAPEAEAAGYQTYSQILGYRGATAVTVSLVGLQGLLSWGLWQTPALRLNSWLNLLLAAVVAVYLAVLGAFWLRPSRWGRWLQPVSEAYVAALLLAYPLQWWLA